MHVSAAANHQLAQKKHHRHARAFLVCAFLAVLCSLAMMEPAFAGTGSGTGGAASARIQTVVTGWQTIIVTAGVAILVIAWSVIGYFIAFGGKTMKDMMNPLIGSTTAGLAPVLVGWMFS